MRLKNCFRIARFRHRETGQEVNLHKGTSREGWDYYFYLRSGKRVFVTAQERTDDWERIAK